MKKLKLLTVTALAAAMTTAYASGDIAVKVDGRTLSFDVPPQIVDGRTLVPMRAIFEELGATVDWDGSTKTVTASKDEVVIKMVIGDNSMSVGDTTKTLDVPPQIIDDRTLVPARAVSESLGCNVEWDEASRTVNIKQPEAAVIPTASPAPEATPDVSSDTANMVKSYPGSLVPDYYEVTKHEQSSQDLTEGAAITHFYKYEDIDTLNKEVEQYRTYLTDNGWTKDDAGYHKNDNTVLTIVIEKSLTVSIKETVAKRAAYDNSPIEVLDFGIYNGVKASSEDGKECTYDYPDSESAEDAVKRYGDSLLRYSWNKRIDHGADGTMYAIIKGTSAAAVYLYADGGKVHVIKDINHEGTFEPNYIYFTSVQDHIDETSAKYDKKDFEEYLKYIEDLTYIYKQNQTNLRDKTHTRIENGVKFVKTSGKADKVTKPQMERWEHTSKEGYRLYIYCSENDDGDIVKTVAYALNKEAGEAEYKELAALVSKLSDTYERAAAAKGTDEIYDVLPELADSLIETFLYAEGYKDFEKQVQPLKGDWEMIYQMCYSGNDSQFSNKHSVIQKHIQDIQYILK